MKTAPLALLFVAGCARLHARYADVNGLHMYVEEAGSGPPLVLIHGGGSTVHTTFGALLPGLAARHRVVGVELEGHGHTADTDRPWSFDQMADDTAALLDQIGIGEADVFGYSMGGRVALHIALRRPDLVRRLIVASSFYSRAGMPPEFWTGMEKASPDGMPAVLRDAYLAASPRPDLARFVEKSKAMMLAARDLAEDELRSIRAPTLILVGDSDVILPEHAVAMFRLVPRAQLAVFPGSPHGAYIGALEYAAEGSRQPEAAAAMIEAFLTGGGGA